MIVSPGLAKRVGIAKGVGFLFGLCGAGGDELFVLDTLPELQGEIIDE